MKRKFAYYFFKAVIAAAFIVSAQANDPPPPLKESFSTIQVQANKLVTLAERLQSLLKAQYPARSERPDLENLAEAREDLVKHTKELTLHSQEALEQIERIDFLKYKKVLLASASTRSLSALTRIKIFFIRIGSVGVDEEITELLTKIDSQLSIIKQNIEKIEFPSEELRTLTVEKTAFGDNDLRLIGQAQTASHPQLQVVGSLMGVFPDPEAEAAGPEPGSTPTFAEPFCSGIQISAFHVLTARHCLTEGMPVIFNKMRLADADSLFKIQVVTYGVEVTPLSPLRFVFTGQEIPESALIASSARPVLTPWYVHPTLDFAIFEFSEKIPGDFLDLRRLTKFSASAPSKLLASGYPQGLPLTVAANCRGFWQAQAADSKVMMLIHDCDTLTGSSGGPIFAVEKQGRLHPLAMQVTGPFLNRYLFSHQQGKFEPFIFPQGNQALSLHTIFKSLPRHVRTKLNKLAIH